ncbi:MAG: aspartate aminotransferase family protein [Pirellulaceae bacterium]|nr:aspartate aminotransferase family protein [Pirellulaceae bacterium]
MTKQHATAVPAMETPAIEHPAEPQSNQWRQRMQRVEPLALRTFTPTQAILARSAGSYHWTSDGRKLADFTSGVLVANLGHNPTRWWQRVLKYLGLERFPNEPAGQPESPAGYFPALPLTAYNAVTELEVMACERLLANMQGQPGGQRMERVMWAASGSEAIQKALWAALALDRNRNLILATRGGFHGKKGLAGAVTGSEQDADRDPRVRFIGFPKQECINVHRREQPIDLAIYQRELEEISKQCGNRIACLITEPYLGGGGSFHPQPEYLQLLEHFCRQHQALLILDEIQANFGRTGPMYAYTRYGIQPDIVCLGKGLGNGIPVSAAVGRSDVFAALAYGEGSDTWSANPLASAGVLATLDEFEATDVLQHASQLSEVIRQGLLRLQDTGLIAHVRGEGCVWGIECQAAGGRSAQQVAVEIVHACYLGGADGLAIHLLGPLAGTVIRISPPLTMPCDEAQRYLEAMYRIVSQNLL